jgi:hypothetical protein
LANIYLDRVQQYTGDFNGVPQYGDGGYIDTAENSFLYGLGGSLNQLGTYTDQSLGMGAGMADFGSDLMTGRTPRREYSWNDMQEHPLDYATDPNGLLSSIASMAGSSLPGTVATLGATALIGATGGAAAAPLAAAVAEGSTLARALTIGGKVASSVMGAAVGGGIDSAIEGGQSYQQAIQQGQSQDQARQAMDTTFEGNVALSTAENLIGVGMLKNAAGVGSRLLGREVAGAAESEGSNLLNALADFGDKNFATRMATRGIPGSLAEGYTEGLQNEIQNYAVNGTDINYNPLNMDDDSKTQMAQAFFGMLPTGAVGAVGRSRRGNVVESSPEEGPIEQVAPQIAQQVAPVEGEINDNISQPIDNAPIEGEVSTDQDAQPYSFNDELQNYIANPTERDLSERESYNGNQADEMAYNQALANMANDNNIGQDVLNKDTVQEGDRDAIANQLVQSQELSGINDIDTARNVADLMIQRNSSDNLRNEAQSLLQQKADMGLTISDNETQNAAKANPDSVVVDQTRNDIRSAKERETLTPSQRVDRARELIQNDVAEKGVNSEFYTGNKKLSDNAKQRLDNLNVSPENSAITREIATQNAQVDQQTQAENTAKLKQYVPEIQNSLLNEGVNSKYYVPNGDISKLSPEVANTLQVNGEINPHISDRITKLSKNAERKQNAETEQATKEQALNKDLSLAQNISNINSFGISLDPNKLKKMSPSKRKKAIDSANNKISTRKERADVDLQSGLSPERNLEVQENDTTKSIVNHIASLSSNPESVEKAINNMTDKYLKYQKLNWSPVLSKFEKGKRDSAQKAIVKYMNYRVGKEPFVKRAVEQQQAEEVRTANEKIQKEMAKQHIVNPKQTATKSVLYGALQEILGKDSNNNNKRMSVMARLFNDPRNVFKEYLPRAMSVYDLADKARRRMEDTVQRYNGKFSDIYQGLGKKHTDELNKLVLYADQIHRDPVQVVGLDDGTHLVLTKDSYIEHFEDLAQAEQTEKQMRDSGQYQTVKSVAETPNEDNMESGPATTVYALSGRSKAFTSEESANKYANSIYNTEINETVNSISNKEYSQKDSTPVAEAYKKYRDLMDEVWNEIVSASTQNRQYSRVPKKVFGYYPHQHLPFVIYEQDKAGIWHKTNSFYTVREANKYVNEVNKNGGNAQYAEMSPFDSIIMRQQINKTDNLTPEQLQELKDNGLLRTPEGDYEDSENHNKALKSVFNPLFKDSDTAKIEDVIKAVHKAQNRSSNTSSQIYNNTVKAAQNQIKSTNIIKQLQRIKAKQTITQTKLNDMINQANMHHKFYGSLLMQTDAKGYSQNVQNTVYRYLMGAANYSSKEKFFSEATATYSDVFHGADFKDQAVTQEQKFLQQYIRANYAPNSVTALDNLIDEAITSIPGLGTILRRFYSNKPYTDFARSAISMQNVLKLGMFNPSSAFVQMAQLLNANAKLGGNKLFGMSSYFRKGLNGALIDRNESNAKYKELYDYIGVDNKHFALDSELIGTKPGIMDKKLLFGKSLNDFANKSMFFFNLGDQGARKATAIGAYLKGQDQFSAISAENKNKMLQKATAKWESARRKAIENKESFSEAKPTMDSIRKDFTFKYAKDIVTDTNFDYSVVNTPLAMTQLGLTGKLLLQFKKYPIFTLNFLRHNNMEENVRFLVPMMVLSGVLGMPAANFFDDASDKITGHSPILAMKKAMITWAGDSPTKKALVNVAMYGAPSLANINLSGRIGLGDAVALDLGPTVSTIDNILQGRGVVKSLAPRAGSLDSIISGKYENTKGDTIANLSPYDRMLKGLGFKPISETNASDTSRVLNQYKEKYNQIVSEAKKEYVKNPNAENYQALVIYGVRESDMAKMLQTKNTSTVDKQLKSIPKRGTSDDTKDLQELAKAAQGFTK